MPNLILLLKIYVSIFGKIFSYVIPPLVSLFIYSIISFFLTLEYQFFLAIALSIPLVLIYIGLYRIFLKYSIMTDAIVDVLKKDMEKHSEGLSERLGRIYPDTPMVNLKNYIDALTSLRTNGYLEFNNCQNMGLNPKNMKSLLLHAVTPGMMKYFMVLSADGESTKNGYIRINTPDNLGVDDRDFTETWYNHIFPILGNLSTSVSEKLADDFTDGPSNGHFIITNFRIINKGGKGKGSLRIYL